MSLYKSMCAFSYSKYGGFAELEELRRKEKVLEIADRMIDNDWRLLDLVSNFQMPLTTIYRMLTRDLRRIDYERYQQCRRIMQNHKQMRKPRGRRY